jgi:predicted enzyme related to lactoylglutathione lyase
MAELDRYIPGVPCWIDTSRSDPDAAAEFYAGLFGWELEETMPPGSSGKYLVARLGGGDVAAISSQPEGAPSSPDWNTYVWVESADETAAKVREAGGTVLSEPFDVFDAGRMAVFADPQGARFSVWEPNEFRGATVVNEPGSLNFNDLHTRDLEGAKAFYGAVFGWEALDTGGGFAMWALAGYGDLLEQRNPGNRAGMAEMGAPERFEDVVASLSPITDDTPPHWSLTFAVEDADATAKRAEELGGQVVVPPFDAPWVRMTILTDPQGATFTASKFVPENRDMAGQEADAAVRGS